MRFLSEVGQVLIALSFSVAIALWLGSGTYVTVAIFVFATTWMLMFDAGQRELQAPTPPSLLMVAFTMTSTAIVFAMIWPSVPVILTWSFLRRRGDDENVIRRSGDGSS
jgi:hypothetical protein